MRNLKIILLFFVLASCQIPNKEHLAIGTWNRCDKNGIYSEYKITENYLMNISTNSDDIWFYKINIFNNNLIVSEFENGQGLLINNDTLITTLHSKEKLTLKSTYTYEALELNKVEIDFEEIDSTNLKAWKNKTLSEFKKRAFLSKCVDLRTENEKRIPIININDSIADIIVPLKK